MRLGLEALTMSRAIVRAKHVTDERRARIARGIELARQKTAAAEALLAAELRVEAAFATRAAFEHALDGLREGGSPRSISEWTGVLLPLGLSPHVIESVRRAHADLDVLDTTKLEREAPKEIGSVVLRALRSLEAIDHEVALYAQTPKSIRVLRVTRAIRAVCVIAVLGAAGVTAWRFLFPMRVTATASATWLSAPHVAPSMAVDGDPATNWVLPDRTPGWIELRLDPPRSVGEVVLRNTSNGTYQDRGTNEYKIEIFRRGTPPSAVAKTITGRFEWAATPQPRSIPVHVSNVDRIRIHVISWHRSGGGFDEISVD